MGESLAKYTILGEGVSERKPPRPEETIIGYVPPLWARKPPKEIDPPSTIIGYTPKAMFLSRVIPKAKPIAYPPPPPFKMPRYSKEVLLTPWVQELMQAEGINALVKGAVEAKKKVEDELNLFVRDITYPEKMINETTNRFLSKERR